ncbi:hypothetical protein BX661DRAFT_67093 [Kickxella alabastrina]|uniref:uncharacterized protein n=1 Tax=Kickxella alabastrina TaxID=61397 RepID=UPI00221FD9DB|nr:uncharacterized protein BX661DRAFT_67093 [Kickxella alabastrina]KAI7833970.1 hypothetical protein BX661DRAFT_67093 [Kickxella alabastrina]
MSRLCSSHMRIQAYALWKGRVYQGVIIVSPDLILYGTINALLVGMLRLIIVKQVFINIYFHIVSLLNKMARQISSNPTRETGYKYLVFNFIFNFLVFLDVCQAISRSFHIVLKAAGISTKILISASFPLSHPRAKKKRRVFLPWQSDQDKYWRISNSYT